MFCIVFLQASIIGGLICNFYSANTPPQLSSLKDSTTDILAIDDSVPKQYLDNSIRNTPFEFMNPINPSINSPRASIGASIPTGRKNFITTGTIRIAVLLMAFTDVSFASTHNLAYYSHLLFNHSNPKSLATYYWENSYGQLNITGEIVGGNIYRSSHVARYWGEDSTSSGVFPQVDNKNDYIYNLVDEGAQLADSNVNFTKFDSDGDTIIDYLLVIHAGDAQEATGVSTDIWSHRWSIQHSCIVDSVVVKDYTMCAETSPMGTFAHELGHAIGNLPDLYDTDYSSDGIGRWGLMGAGAWNYNETIGSGETPGDTPSHLCAYSKIKMGWLTPAIVTTDGSMISLPAIEASNQESVLKIFLSNQTNSVTLHEYLLICFRNQTGFDSALPGSGILIWHIDECNKYEANDGERRKLVDLEEADGGFDPSGILWEQLDYTNKTAPLGVMLPDDNGNINDPWLPGSIFDAGTFPNSNSNDGIITNIHIAINKINQVNITVSYDPLPWNYELWLMNRSMPNFIDEEPSMIEDGSTMYGVSQKFKVVWHSNRTGVLDIYGAITNDAGHNWISSVQITSSNASDYSPSLIIGYPPSYWCPIYKENKPISSWSTSLNARPPPHYVVAFVSNRTGNPEIFLTVSPDFFTWSRPVQITNDSAHDIDPCLFQTTEGELGLFWASNRSSNFEIYCNKYPWNKSKIIQVTNNILLDRGPSYFFSQNNTHLLAFERRSGGISSIQFLSTDDLTIWPLNSITCTNPLYDSTEPSLIECSDRTLMIAYTEFNVTINEIHQIVSSNWTHWSLPHRMIFLKETRSPSLIEAACGALLMAYTAYNSSQLPHIYLIFTTQCYHIGVGIRYPQDTGDSFFNPSRVEYNSDWVFSGELRLNESDFTAPGNNITLIITDTKNTWNESDDKMITERELRPGDPPPPFEIELNFPALGLGRFTIPLQELIVYITPEELPTGTILRFQIIWWYKDLNEQQKNINSSIFVELLIPQQHVQIEGNIPQTTIDTPITRQAPIISGFASYGVESITLSLYNTTGALPPLEQWIGHYTVVNPRKTIETALNTINELYSQQTIVLTELAKARGTWTAFLHNLRDNVITKVIATSNGIYPRKNETIFLHKLPWDTNSPRLTQILPIEPHVEDFPITFSEEIQDDRGSFNYGIDQSSITFVYRVLNTEDPWMDVYYSDTDSNWSKSGNIYNYTLDLENLDKPIYIAYYWTTRDLAIPSNCGFDGDRENPYFIGIYPRDTETYTTIIYDTVIITVPCTETPLTTIAETTTSTPTSTTGTTIESGEATGFQLLILIGTLGALSIMIKKRRGKPQSPFF